MKFENAPCTPTLQLRRKCRVSLQYDQEQKNCFANVVKFA